MLDGLRGRLIFDTLATHVFQFASDELLEQSALAALTIVVAGVIPVILLSRAIRASHPASRAPSFYAAPLPTPPVA